jgi:hypothetical protein
MLLDYQGCYLFESLLVRKVFQDAQRRFCVDSKLEKLDPKLSSGRPSHAFGCPLVFRSFELFKVASVWTSRQCAWMLIRVGQEI